MSHDEVWHLIPWLVNGRAGDAEREQIDAHLRVCDECRNEVAAQRQVMSAIASDKRIDCVPGAAFERLWDRISAEEAPQARGARLKQVRTRSVMKWLAAAVVVEAIGITALTVALSSRNSVEQAAAEYRTVTSSASTETRGSIRAVFAPALPMSELQRILDQSGLQIVAGPTESGVYTLATTAPAGNSGSDSALAGLRASPAVRFAEPIAK
jgi:anti-sigma factor RsiW